MLETPSSLGQLYTQLIFFSFAVLFRCSPYQLKPENTLHGAFLAFISFFTLFSSLSFPIVSCPLIPNFISAIWHFFQAFWNLFLNLPLSSIAVNYWYERQHIPNNAFWFSHCGFLWQIFNSKLSISNRAYINLLLLSFTSLPSCLSFSCFPLY